MSSFLHRACAAIAQGTLPTATAKLLSSSTLIALRKSTNTVRPIAIGEVLRRLTAKAISLQKKKDFSEFFSSIQHGVSTKCGTELLANHVQLLLESHTEWIMLKTDVANAFNSLDRRQMLAKVAASFPDLFDHVNQMYLVKNPLLFLQHTKMVLLSFQQGIYQGDPWVKYCFQ